MYDRKRVRVKRRERNETGTVENGDRGRRRIAGGSGGFFDSCDVSVKMERKESENENEITGSIPMIW